MAGIVIDPSNQPDTDEIYADTGGEYVPPAGTVYYILTRNGVPETNGVKYPVWDYANADAQALNNGADDVDNNAWGVTEVLPAGI